MRFLDVYPECTGCPVKKYCGKMISSRRLCNSYELNNKKEDGDNTDNNRNSEYYTVHS